MKIGIFAYGSIIEECGDEIESFLKNRIENVETPFKIEFARSSKGREKAPTLVEYDKGSSVQGQILLLKDIELQKAKDILYRREIDKVGTEKKYDESKKGKDRVKIKILENFQDIDCVLYTKISANIENPTSKKLAKLAIESAKDKKNREDKRDGINYLMSVKRQGIKTPMMDEYEQEICKILEVQTLKEALEKVEVK